MNKYPAWKYLLIALALAVAFLYTVPNFFGEMPAVQVSGLRTLKADANTRSAVEEALKAAQIETAGILLEGDALRVKFKDTDTQLKARDVIQQKVGEGYIAALNLVSNSPAWLSSINALPMYLGLDLRGGVHFLMQVDMKAALNKAVERYAGDTRILLRDKKIYYNGIARDGDKVVVRFKENAEREKAEKEIVAQLPDLNLRSTAVADEFVLTATMKPEAQKALQDNAIQQNITALRKRVNELGVSEPIVQQQGPDRILVQLAGVQDPTRAKDVIGRTATLELRNVAHEHMVGSGFEHLRNEPAPFNTEKMIGDKGEIVLVRKAIVITPSPASTSRPASRSSACASTAPAAA
jgi:preprotein translocase subunit SecD